MPFELNHGPSIAYVHAFRVHHVDVSVILLYMMNHLMEFPMIWFLAVLRGPAAESLESLALDLVCALVFVVDVPWWCVGSYLLAVLYGFFLTFEF